MSLLVISIEQPYASLAVHGHKQWECRTSPPAGDMRPAGVRPYPGYRVNRGTTIAIAAGKSWAPGWSGWFDPDERQAAVLADLGADLNEDVNGSGMVKLDRYSLPLGAIVGTVTVVDALPIDPQVGHEDEDYTPPDDHIYTTVDGKALYRQTVIGDPSDASNVVPTDLTDQLDLGWWRPGWWAWQLTNHAPTTERCPRCEGTGVAPWEALTADEQARWGEPMADLSPCPTCSGLGYCPPIPFKGGQGVRRWEP